MTPVEIEMLRKLCDAASPGPWEAGHLADDEHSCQCAHVLDEGHAGGIGSVYVDDGTNFAPKIEEAKANLLFIAAARQALPKLLKEAEALAEAAWSILDDMGKNGQSACGAAKAQLRIAYEPFYEIEDRDKALYDETWMSLEEARAIMASID
jgi:hypothetical protein